MVDCDLVTSPLIMNKEVYCVISGGGMFQFIPNWPNVNPYDELKIPNDFRIEFNEFRFADYAVRKDDAVICGSSMFMILQGIFIDGDYHETYLRKMVDKFSIVVNVLTKTLIVDKMVCIDLSNRNFKRTFDIDEHNRAAVELVYMKKTNFDEVEYEGLRYLTDEKLLIYVKFDEKGRFVPYYVVDIEARRVTKVNTNMSNYGFPHKYDNAILQIRVKKRCTGTYIENGNNRRPRQEIQNVLDYKIVRYNVPTLFQLCRDYIISTDLVKSLDESQKNMLF